MNNSVSVRQLERRCIHDYADVTQLQMLVCSYRSCEPLQQVGNDSYMCCNKTKTNLLKLAVSITKKNVIGCTVRYV